MSPIKLTINARDWFIDTLKWTTALLYGLLQGMCNMAGVLKTHALTNVMRAQTAGQNNNGYCYDACTYCRAAKFSFVTENILFHTCVVLKTYDAIYSVVYVLESNAYYCAIISSWVTNKKFASSTGTLTNVKRPFNHRFIPRADKQIVCLPLFSIFILIRSIGCGLGWMTIELGSIAAPLTFIASTYLWEPLAFFVFGGCALLASLLTLWLPETKGLSLPETMEEGEHLGW